MNGLNISGYQLSPTFDNGTYEYSADGSAAQSTVTATPVDDTATVSATLGGQAVDLSQPIDLAVGPNTLVVSVTEA